METLKKYFDLQDFEGQKKATLYFKIILIVAGIIGFAVGFVLQNFYVSVAILFVGYLIAVVVSVPSWSMYNKMNISFGKNQVAPGIDKNKR